MNMKPLLKSGIALVALYCSGFALAGGEGWSIDFAAAKKEAAESKKDLLLDFTGSDWCPPCIMLNKEILSQDAFKAGVKDKFVLMELDYPKDKSKLSEDTIKQNEELAKKYQIKGFPTILLCDAEGKPFAATGYQPGGPEAYVKHLDTLRAKKTVRDESFASAAKSEGVAKAKALVAALGAMGLEDSMIQSFYGDVSEQIKAADPKDETGFAKAAAAKARMARFQKELGALGQKQDHDGALLLVDKTLKEEGFGTEETQQLIMTRAMILAHQQKHDEAIKAVDEAKAVAPDSEISARIDGFKARLEEGKKKLEEAKAAEDKKPAEGEKAAEGEKSTEEKDSAEEK
ncbi:MAG TPA: thioredoxin fold domain-containing protein [Luteolibacter sp.]